MRVDFMAASVCTIKNRFTYVSKQFQFKWQPLYLQVTVLSLLVVGIFGSSLQSYNAPAPSYNAPAPTGPAQYDFNYAVKHDYSNNDFGHQENRNGYDTQGAYFVLLPDSRIQRVSYNVNGDAGYVAQVTYEGEAQYRAPRPSTSYQPAP
ncbi:pro-resilin-like [Penaeus monodon]|uniref:pro-resilin-like n=1 Tax=Penaeus monodon TaxID=6687 RepID=UPI0018A7035F|nr:pro-resilin-like [Penaeus monodon]